jgi:hypothetical protein
MAPDTAKMVGYHQHAAMALQQIVITPPHVATEYWSARIG